MLIQVFSVFLLLKIMMHMFGVCYAQSILSSHTQKEEVLGSSLERWCDKSPKYVQVRRGKS